tara:strand:- start:4395 stop:5609 length:1215 start_codon:yes stop_codon:yes gene_type:complete
VNIYLEYKLVIYSVSQIIEKLKKHIAQDDFIDIWVKGEVSNFVRPLSGHSYFTLKDDKTSIRCVMFKNSLGAEYLADGVLILTHGKFSIYQTRGDLQLVADIIQPEGEGTLRAEFEKLKLKLSNEGFFEVSRKRALPSLPSKIAVVTSPSGAVWKDIQNVISRRFPLVELILLPTIVQGHLAAQSIIENLEYIRKAQNNIDLVILARGGGSLEDLWPFNDESVAHSIFSSPVPVVSAIGHETDITISDLVADVRAPTPSAAAEIVVPNILDLNDYISIITEKLQNITFDYLGACNENINNINLRYNRVIPDFDSLKIRLGESINLLDTFFKHKLQMYYEKSNSIKSKLHSLSPDNTLKRGYAIIQGSEKKIISDIKQISIGHQLEITLKKGEFTAIVNKINKKD